ncbi:MAG: hypothetical protein HYT49_03540 [Candidatus Wildermuthbacteria bacterium]|nr:hypothetical protein [Candidatus Wildermuthbacteria bacterium]
MFHDFKTEIKLFLVVALVAVTISIGGIFLLKAMQVALVATPQPQNPQGTDRQIYRNEEYGFELVLSGSWEGYTIIPEFWSGQTLDGRSTEFQGSKVVIRSPNWSVAQPWQDIPVLVFTKQEWQLIEAANLNISAAPIGPQKLGENQQYVFALPPRWVGFTDALGQDEAEEIVKTFKAIDSIAVWQTYRNEEYGFEVKYPGDFVAQENVSETLTLSFRKNNGFPIWIYAGSNQNERIKERITFIEDTVRQIERRKETVNGVVWNVIEETIPPMAGKGMPGSLLIFYREQNATLYIVQCVNCDPDIFGEQAQETSDIFHKLLSTFRFVDDGN